MLYNTERPLTFDSFRGQKYIVESIRAQAISKKFFGVYVFGGHFGCGKTSMARILTRAANCEHPDENGNPCLVCKHCKAILSGSIDIVEIDAATNTGVDSIRELRETVNFKPAELERKFYIIDEVHMLSKGAFNALLKVLEEPPEFVTFILCTTEVSAIPATIRSRGACYFFEQLTCDELAAHVEDVACRNGITLLTGAADMIAKYSQGAARNALSILDQVSTIKKEVSAEMVQRLLGVSDNTVLFRFLKELLASDTIGAVSVVEELSSSGKDFVLLCDDLIEIVTDTILFSIGGKNAIRNTEQYVGRINGLVSVSSSDRLCVLAEHLHLLKKELHMHPGKGTVLAAVIRLTMDTNNSVIALTNRIAVLEKELSELKASGMSMTQTNIVNGVPEKPVGRECVSYDLLDDITCNAALGDIVSESDKLQGTIGTASETFEEESFDNNVCVASTNSERKVLPVEAVSDIMDGTEGSLGLSGAHEDAFSDVEFDVFDVFDFDTAKTVALSVSTVGVDRDVLTQPSGVSTDVLKEATQLVERIAVEHKIFATALRGCTIKEKCSGLYIESELPEVRKIVEFYINHYKGNGFEVASNIIV